MKENNSYAVTELKAMLPYLLIFNGAAVAVAIFIGIAFGFDWRVYTGLVVGNILMTGNFLLIGLTAGKIVKVKDFRRGRNLAGLSYGLRYAGIFAVLAGLLTLKVINPISAVIPLFFPKIYYTFFYIRSEKEDKEI